MFLRYNIREDGLKESVHKCDTCGAEYSICPAIHPENEEGWNNCMMPHCPSYDATRDGERLFGDDSQLEKHKNLYPGKELDESMPPPLISKDED